MTIGIDIDDTLFNTNEILIEKALYYDKHFLEDKGFKNENEYKLEDMLYWTLEDKEEFFKWFIKGGYLFNVSVKENAPQIIDGWKKLGCKIVIITYRQNRDGLMYEKTHKMLVDNGVYFDKLIVDSGAKGPVCEEEKVDIFIDDSYTNCVDALDHNVGHVIMFRTKYNNYKDLFSLSNWNEIDEYVRRVIDER